MIKIMHFIHGLSTGGAETLVKNYMLNFDNKKFDIVLLCINHFKKSPYEKELIESGVRILFLEDYFPFKKNIGRLRGVFNKCCKYYFARKIIKRESPDIIHSHLMINRLLKFARPKKNTLLIHTIHSDPDEIWNSKKNKKDYSAAKWLVRNRGMRFIVLHEAMRGKINTMFGLSNTVILNNGVDVESIKNAKQNIRKRNELGISKSAFVVGHIGRFSSVKNHALLVDIFIDIYKQNKNSFLLMIGDGPDKDIIINKLEKNGMKGNYSILSNRNDIPDILGAMDVFVFPSLYEGLPLSLIEAQIAKKPCFISYNVNEYAIISNLVTRISLKDNAMEWTEKILSYKAPSKIMVNDEDWNIKIVTKKLEHFYLDVLAEKHNGEE